MSMLVDTLAIPILCIIVASPAGLATMISYIKHYEKRRLIALPQQG